MNLLLCLLSKARLAIAVVVFPKIQDFARLTFYASSTTQTVNGASSLSTVAARETETTLLRERNVPTFVATQNAKEVSSKARRFIVLMLNVPYSVNRQILIKYMYYLLIAIFLN